MRIHGHLSRGGNGIAFGQNGQFLVVLFIQMQENSKKCAGIRPTWYLYVGTSTSMSGFNPKRSDMHILASWALLKVVQSM